MNMPSAIYVWLVPSEHVQEQPGSWRIRKWDTEPFPEANFTLGSEKGEPSMPDEVVSLLADYYRELRSATPTIQGADRMRRIAALIREQL